MKLILGAAVFGAGWGLAGYCPGPGLVSAMSGGAALLFVGALLTGTYLVAKLEALSQVHEPANPTVPTARPQLQAEELGRGVCRAEVGSRLGASTGGR